MVPRPRLLLSARLPRLVGWLALALLAPGCPAEMMGVELPHGGPDTISQEDLQRDAWALQRAPAARAGQALAQRLGEMRVLPAAGRAWGQGQGEAERICGRKDGHDARAWVIVARGDPSSAEGALSWAVLVSAAKGFDTATTPAQTLLFCAVRGDAGAAALIQAPPVPADHIDGLWVVDGVGEGKLLAERRPGPFASTADLLAALPATPDGGPDDLGAVDYRRVADQLRDVVGALAADLAAQP